MRSRFKNLRILALMLVAVGGLVIGSPTMAQVGAGTRFTASTDGIVEESRFDSTLAKYTPASTGNVGVVITIDDAPLATYNGGVAGFPATNPAVTGKPLDVNSADSRAYLAYLNSKLDSLISTLKVRAPGAAVSYRYDIALGGIAAQVPAAQVNQLRGLPNVDLIVQDHAQQIDTDRTPQFIGATTAWGQLGGQESAGEGVIVGVLDTGIWPEHPSLSDPDPSGKPYTPAPGTYKCEFGSAIPGDAPFTCNNKLIGAYRFMNGYTASSPLLPNEFRSARDDDGHGTHTATTSAGNANVAASIFGVSRGIISGIAPRAHVIAYKICGANGCFSSDSVAAVEQAILDHVNVINYSISGGANPYTDVVSQAFLAAYNAGIFVAASAGNSGPTPDTTDHREPWVTTVAASTADRAFKNTLTLSGSAGATLSIRGVSLTGGVGASPLVVASDPLCTTPAAPGTYTGEIVICRRGGNGRVNKGFNVFQGGAAGMVLYNQSAAVTDQETDNHFLPTTHIQFSEGQQVLAFLAANPGATATIGAGEKDTQQGDVMASFSSRGGPGQNLGVSKPDVTAPGVQILAGNTPLGVDGPGATGPQGELFQAIAGTSMSSPHVAGAGALLKALHPTWTPGQIKSALMTSASTVNLVKEDGVTPFNAFDAGSGRIDLSKAGTPGLLFADSGANYVALKDKLWNSNYPSLYVPVMPGQITVQRTAQDVTGRRAEWKLRVSYPAGQANDFSVSVPEDLTIQANGSKTFGISLDGRDVPLGQVRFATITLSSEVNDQRIVQHFPVTIVRKQAVVSLTKTCDPTTVALNASTTCTVTATNNSASPADVTISDRLPRQLELLRSSVVGGSAVGGRVAYTGTIPGRQPTGVTAAVSPGASPAGGYLPLSLFGIAPIAGVGDETINNFNVPAFTLGGNTYSRIGVVSDGYLVVGGGTGADIDYINHSLPDAARPNNVLAPFWTDLDGSTVGAVRIATLTDGVRTWLIVDYDGVPNYSSSAEQNSFQVWIGLGADANDVTYAYGTVTGGEGGSLTVGAENEDGSSGNNVYFNGTGTPPADDIAVSYTPGQTFSQTLSYRAKGGQLGAWVNYAELRAPALFDGTSISRVAGSVTP